MGICASDDYDLDPDEKAQSRKLDERLKGDYEKQRGVHKLLLLGAGESGKSTLFKQLTAIYQGGFSEKERKEYRPVVHSNIIAAAQMLCKFSDVFHERSQESGNQSMARCAVLGDAAPLKRYVQSLRPLDTPLSEEICAAVLGLWGDPGIQATYALRGLFSLPDSARYFFERLREGKLWSEEYVPTLQDVIRSRVRTTGILEKVYKHGGATFQLYDVGGQRNERRKWIHLFESVTAVLFVASLNAYSQVLYEDPSVNRMDESLRLFEEVCGLKWFAQTNIILFLNKKDLFRETLLEIPLTACFPDYKSPGPVDPSDAKAVDALAEDAIEFCQLQFLRRNANPNKTVYTHATNATDTRNVHVVFNSCQDIIIKRSLEQAGLLMLPR